MSEEKYIWNFAYGSNMNFKILEGRRKIKPLETARGIVKGYQLDFNLPTIPYLEPGMGSVSKNEGSEIHGFLIKLTEKEFYKLYETEGKNNNYYKVDLMGHII
jgi:hypothetical protein